jgi:hypothetical protein
VIDAVLVHFLILLRVRVELAKASKGAGRGKRQEARDKKQEVRGRCTSMLRTRASAPIFAIGG